MACLTTSAWPDFIKWHDPRPTWQHWLFERGCTNASLLSIQRETFEFASCWTWYSKSRTESRRQNNPELQSHYACRKMSICPQEQITSIVRVISPMPLQHLFCPKKCYYTTWSKKSSWNPAALDLASKVNSWGLIWHLFRTLTRS